MATTSLEHRVACHQYASERKRAGRKPWDLRLTLGPLPEDGAPQEWAAIIARQLKASPWARRDLSITQDEWAESGATAEPDFLYDTPLGQIVERLEGYAEDGLPVTEDDINWELNEMYDYADLGPTRVWITLEH